jgi:NADPH:quinone reductase
VQKIVVSKFGDPGQLEVGDVERTQPSEDEVLIAVEAAGVNYVDVYHRSGYYPLPLPFTPGYEGVGRIEAIGSNVHEFAIGDRIAWVNVLGTYAQVFTAPAANVFLLPDDITLDQGMLFQAITAQYLVTEYRRVGRGDVVLIHAAAGGVGQLLVQWCKHLGATVIATTSSIEKCELARSLGANYVIDYSEGEFVGEVMRLTDGRGADLVFDPVGKSTLLKSVESLANRGTVISFGSASGAPPSIDPQRLIDKSARVAGGTIFEHTKSFAELRGRVEAALTGIREGWLKIADSRRYPLSEAARAHQDIGSRQTTGKLILMA